SDPGNKGYQSDLTIALEKVGDALLAKGEIDAAIEIYDEQLGISRTLSASDPGNKQWQRSVAVALERMGDALVKKGDNAGALPVFEESLAINRVLVES